METVATQDIETLIVDNVAETVVVEVPQETVVLTGIMGPPGTSNISAASDVDLTDLTNGATLVYKSDTARWRATKLLDSQILEAGQF